ncbi:MAG TPA: acyl carrier protein [Eudoraea sp.]|nr:acyl carrier protein [Eudoraea sp.]
MKDKIINYIKSEISNDPLQDIGPEDDLLGSGIIDSLGMMKLVLFIEKECHMKINNEDMTVENFMTVQNILNFLGKDQG